MRCIIFDYQGGSGFGDFIRSASCWIEFCKDYSITLYIDIREHPIGQLLTFKEMYKKPDEVESTEQHTFRNVSESVEGPFVSFMKIARRNDSQFCARINSNWFQYRRCKLDFFKPNFSVPYPPNEFCVVYFRCGDIYHGHKGGKHDNLTNFPIDEKIKSAVHQIQSVYPSLPIYLFSDHKPFRDLMCKKYGLNQIDTTPIHVGHSSQNTEGAKDMLIDFFVMAKANLLVDIQNKKSWHPGNFASFAASYGNIKRLVIS
jgi:hypothetical protein